jgi:ADP-glucose pyrophosphorylase
MSNQVFDRSQLTRRAMALVLAGGRGSRLKELTDTRSKPAVYFGGKFRIVDFSLSNCLNSNLRRIGVVTQYKSHCCRRSSGSTMKAGTAARPMRSTRTSTSSSPTARSTS